MISLITYFIIVSNLFLYISLIIFKINHFSIIVPLLISIFVAQKINKKNKFKFKINRLFLIGLPLLISNLIILYPLIQNINIDGFRFVSYPSATDFFKHLYTITSIKTFGLPPKHPYMPLSKFTYYYFYYLLPSGFSYLLPTYQHYILYVYVAITSLLSIIIITYLISSIIKNKLAKLIALSYIFYGQGLDIIPTIIGPKQTVNRLIEMWSIKANLGLRIDNPFIAFIWTPQHFFSATIGLLFVYYLTKKKFNPIIASLLLSFTIGSSIFVSISICFLISILFLSNYHHQRISIIKTITITAITIIPFFFYIKSSAGNIFNLFSYNPYQFTKSGKLINTIICLLIDYGPIYFINLFLLPTAKLSTKNKIIFFLCLVSIPTTTLFIRSPNYNDFGLRANLPIQIISAIFFAYLIQTKPKTKPVLIFIFLINIFISSLGFLYEIKVRWQDRQILDVSTSQLINQLRKFNQNKTISVLGKGEWVYKIPPLGFKPIYSSDLYDSANYFNHHSRQYSDFTIANINLFKPNISTSITQLINDIQHELDNMALIFSSLETDYTLINKKIFVKQDVNPYFNIFIDLFKVDHIKLTDNFYLINNKSALNKLNQYKLVIKSASQINLDKHKSFNLNQGLYIISICNPTPINQCYLFEPEEHYTLINTCLDTTQCVGQIFFQPNQSQTNIKINTDNNLKTIYVSPITTNQN